MSEPINYAILALPCWTCAQSFDVFTDLSNHHLTAHELPLRGQSVAGVLARRGAAGAAEGLAPAQDGMAAAPLRCVCPHSPWQHPAPSFACTEAGCGCLGWRYSPHTITCTCGCPYAAHAAITAEVPLQPCLGCACRAFVLALTTGDAIPQVRPFTAVEWFRRQCAEAGAPCEEIDARLLLDTFGIPPDAPAPQWEGGLAEALAKWRDRARLPLACRHCGAPVPDSPDHRRLQLCALDAAHGCLAECQRCDYSWPEHGPGGWGCATWLPAAEAPFPGPEGEA